MWSSILWYHAEVCQAEGFEHVEKNSKKYTVEYVTDSVQYALMEYKSVYTHTSSSIARLATTLSLRCLYSQV